MPHDSIFQKGGRGKKAPYSTTHMRVPVPLKKDVENLIIAYNQHLESGGDVNKTPFDDGLILNRLPDLYKILGDLKSGINSKKTGFEAKSFSQGFKQVNKLIKLFERFLD